MTTDDGRILLFSATGGYRHESIPAAHQAVAELARSAGTQTVSTEDPRDLLSAPEFDAVVFLSPSGDVLASEQRESLAAYVGAGGGFAAVHAASDCERDWPEYPDLIGAWFLSHPHEQDLVADIRVESRTHPSTRHLDATWRRSEEWYAFDRSPRGRFDVLLSVDESQYLGDGEVAMGEDHPLAWAGRFGDGRTWYSALGHHAAAYAEPAFRAHLWGGISSVLRGAA